MGKESWRIVLGTILCGFALSGFALSGFARAETLSLDELVRNKELLKRVALTKPAHLSTSYAPPGTLVTVTGTKGKKLLVSYNGSNSPLDPDQTDLAERVELLHSYVKEAESASPPSFKPANADVPYTPPDPAAYNPPAADSPLAKVNVPTENSKAAWKDYVSKVVAALKGNTPRNARKDDPGLGAFVKVGPTNVDLLIDAFDKGNYIVDYYLLRAVDALACEDNRTVIIGQLSSHSSLIDVVSRVGWFADAKPILVDLLARQPDDLPNEAFVLAVSYQDPQINLLVRRSLLECNSPSFRLRVLSQKTQLDISGILLLRLKEIRVNPGVYLDEAYYVGEMAGGIGQIDGLRLLVSIFSGTFDESRAFSPESAKIYQNKSRETFIRLTGATGSDAELVSWLKDNESKIRFDPATKKFVRAE